jgi:hypothetical protein
MFGRRGFPAILHLRYVCLSPSKRVSQRATETRSQVEAAENKTDDDFPTPGTHDFEGCELCDSFSACRLIGARNNARSAWVCSCAYRQIIDRVGMFAIDIPGRHGCAYGEQLCLPPCNACPANDSIGFHLVSSLKPRSTNDTQRTDRSCARPQRRELTPLAELLDPLGSLTVEQDQQEPACTASSRALAEDHALASCVPIALRKDR